MQSRVAEIKQSMAANMQALRKYQWLQTTKVSVKGEVKQTQVSSCAYSAPGPKPVCTEMSSTPAAKPSGGPVRKKMMEKAIAEMKAYMDSVKTLMEMYIPPQGAKFEAAMQSGNIAFSKNPSANTASVVIKNYAQQGDAETFVFSDPGKDLKSATISTWLNEPAQVVTLRVTYADLPDGTRYAVQKSLDATAKEINVTVTSTMMAQAPTQ
jgi:hypothetical protein